MPKSGWLTLLQIGKEAGFGSPQDVVYTLPLINDVSIGPIAPNAISSGLVRDGSCVELEEYQGLDADITAAPTKAGGRKLVALTGAQCGLSPRVCQWLFRGLVQSSATAGAGSDLTQALDYATGATTQWYTIAKQMGLTASHSLRAVGCVINRIAIDCPANGAGTITFDAIGKDETIHTGVASTAALTDTVLCTKDATFKWDGDALGPISFNLEFNNNASPVFVDSDTCDAILVGPLNITGSVTCEHVEQIAKTQVDARTGLVKTVQIYWGTTGNDGYLEFGFDAKIVPTPSQTEADNFQQLTVNFEGKVKNTAGESWDVQSNDAEAFS